MKICIWGYFNRPFWGYLIFKAGIYRPTTYMSIEIEWYENIKMYERPFNAIIDVLIAENCKLWFWITSAIACKLGHIILKMMICHLIILIVKCTGVSPSSSSSSPFRLLFFKVSSSQSSIGTLYHTCKNKSTLFGHLSMTIKIHLLILSWEKCAQKESLKYTIILLVPWSHKFSISVLHSEPNKI